MMLLPWSVQPQIANVKTQIIHFHEERDGGRYYIYFTQRIEYSSEYTNADFQLRFIDAARYMFST